jgi:hypothetical protein
MLNNQLMNYLGASSLALDGWAWLDSQAGAFF